jgi:hypothetical protein
MEKSVAYVSRGRYIYRPMTTPFFPAWRPRLAAMGRSVRKCRSAAEVEDQFARFLPKKLLERAPEKEGSRDRIYSRRRTFWLFLWQVLSPKTSCRAVVRKAQAETENVRQKIDESTSGYCQARARLPFGLCDNAVRHTADYADKKAIDGVPGWNRPIKVVDASSTQIPDTTANAKSYHYPTGQKKGCRFPVLRFLALFSFCQWRHPRHHHRRVLHR